MRQITRMPNQKTRKIKNNIFWVSFLMLSVLTVNHSKFVTLHTCSQLISPQMYFLKKSRAPSIRLPSFHRRPRLHHQHRSWPDGIKKRTEQWQTGVGMDPWKDLYGRLGETEKKQAQNLMLRWQDVKQRLTKARVKFLLLKIIIIKTYQSWPGYSSVQVQAKIHGKRQFQYSQ